MGNFVVFFQDATSYVVSSQHFEGLGLLNYLIEAELQKAVFQDPKEPVVEEKKSDALVGSRCDKARFHKRYLASRPDHLIPQIEVHYLLVEGKAGEMASNKDASDVLDEHKLSPMKKAILLGGEVVSAKLDHPASPRGHLLACPKDETNSIREQREGGTSKGSVVRARVKELQNLGRKEPLRVDPTCRPAQTSRGCMPKQLPAPATGAKLVCSPKYPLHRLREGAIGRQDSTRPPHHGSSLDEAKSVSPEGHPRRGYLLPSMEFRGGESKRRPIRRPAVVNEMSFPPLLLRPAGNGASGEVERGLLEACLLATSTIPVHRQRMNNWPIYPPSRLCADHRFVGIAFFIMFIDLKTSYQLIPMPPNRHFAARPDPSSDGETKSPKLIVSKIGIIICSRDADALHYSETTFVFVPQCC
ncbi:unnamed protein product [Protopolystoma xenopodis]|uniref:Uncharacterized protein n=1 Tax=Protopolystoma xenopodis TaxID=117903 RepID=A0A3S4ZNW1_9PLAT|nr:unnamed protein product [Protopolystoma xenopodis]